MIAKGWDIGGVNTKACTVESDESGLAIRKVASRYFEIWKDKDRLKDILKEIDEETEQAEVFGITMTAELSDTFRTKSEGVRFVSSSFEETFKLPMYVIDVFGRACPIVEAEYCPLSFAAANWAATASLVSRWIPNCVLLDIGSTTTDIIPVIGGRIACKGRTDTERLQTGELVFSGMLRTPPSSIVHAVPVDGIQTRVSSEYFCIMGDVYLLLGKICGRDYVCDTPDGREKTKESASERIARLVCADKDVLSLDDRISLARYIAEKQREQIEGALREILSGRRLPLVAAGSGRFIVFEIARRLDLEVFDLSERIGDAASVAPCVGAAMLATEAFG